QLRRNVIFRRMMPEEPIVPTPALAGLEVIPRVSGWFVREVPAAPRWRQRLDALISGAPRSRWFVDVPATLGERGPGELTFFSSLDPSLHFFGIRLENRSGIWDLAFDRESLGDPECGRLYLGLANWPALRIRYVERPSGRRRRAVLRFAND